MIVTYTRVVGVLTIVLTCEHYFHYIQSQGMTARERRVAEETANSVYRVLLVARQPNEDHERHDVA
jgi:ABC-type metal ion transport system substrate-binding protein